jgi:16S rRNA (guanine(966)-N(2))-methyltransferase RsmD
LNRVRIIGGEWRSRLIEFPALPGLRPTPDRVRETLFNWLGHDLGGRFCLDLFAGSGALGFEAASRGAQFVTLVESDRRAVAALERTTVALDARNVEIRHMDALQFLAFSERRYDVVFLDPPYRQGWLDRVLQPLGRVLRPDALIYVEAERELGDLGPWRVRRHKKAGQVHYHLMRVETP